MDEAELRDLIARRHEPACGDRLAVLLGQIAEGVRDRWASRMDADAVQDAVGDAWCVLGKFQADRGPAFSWLTSCFLHSFRRRHARAGVYRRALGAWADLRR